MQPLSGIDAIRRGYANVRANWELVLVQIAQGFVVTLLAIAGFVLPLVAIGFDLWTRPPRSLDALPEWLSSLVSRLSWSPALGFGLAGSLVLLTLASFAFCYFQAGIYGVLAAADRQARPDIWSPGMYRTFELADFAGWGRLYLWRYVGLSSLWLLLSSVVGLAIVGAVVAAAGFAAGLDGFAGCALACGIALPAAFVFLTLGLAYSIAAADLAREDSSVLVATRRGFEILGRRLPANLLLLLSFIAASMAIWLAFLPLEMLSAFALRDHLVLSQGVRFCLQAASWVPTTIIQLIYAASLVALARSEAARA